jgi:hypothetical protein
MPAKEANLISFKVVITDTGAILTELGGLPEDRLHELFTGKELAYMRTIVRESRVKLEKLHTHLENELNVINTTI